jgi:hypothetical protein
MGVSAAVGRSKPFGGEGRMHGRAKPRGYGQSTRAELAESFAHLRAAAGHAGTDVAGTGGAMLGSGAVKLRTGWDAAFAPLVYAARTEARRATTTAAKRKNSKGDSMSRKWPFVMGALATAAVGAYAARKRRNAGRENDVPDVTALDARQAADDATGGAAEQGMDSWGAAKEAFSGARNPSDAAKSMSDKAKNSVPGDRGPVKPLEQSIG